MATNHTANFQLNQWEATDQVLRTDFNDDNTKIDTALNSLSSNVQNHATQLSQIQTTLSKCGTCKFHYQSYVGDGKRKRDFTFPSKPPILFLTSDRGYSFAILADAKSNANEDAYMRFTWTDATLSINTTADYVPPFNTEDITYHMLALLDASL